MTPAALSNAVRPGDEAAVAEVLAAGVDVNAIASAAHQPPLHLAIEHQRAGMARRLIAAGADVNRDLGDGWTPLVHAIDIESDGAWQAHRETGHESTEPTELLLSAVQFRPSGPSTRPKNTATARRGGGYCTIHRSLCRLHAQLFERPRPRSRVVPSVG